MNQFLNLEIQSMEQKHEQLISGLESLLLDTASILKDRQDMIAARDSGLLSDISVQAFASNADKYLEKVAPEWGKNVSGLESDFKDNKEAGLESVLESIKKGLSAFVAFLKKILENIETFFKDVFTKIFFRVKVLEKNLKELEDKVVKMDELPSTNISKMAKIARDNALIIDYGDTSGGVDFTNKPATTLLKSIIPQTLEMLRSSRLPVVDSADDDGVKFKIEQANDMEKKLIIAFKSIAERDADILQNGFNVFAAMNAKTLLNEIDKSIGARVISLSGTSATILMYDKNGLIDYEPIELNQNASHISDGKFKGELNVDKKLAISAIESIRDAIKDVPKLREENEKRIKAMKKASDSIMKMIDEDIKNPENPKNDRFNQLMLMVTKIWRVYPDLNNKTIRALHIHIEKCTSWVSDIVEGKPSSGNTEEVETEIVE